MQFGCTWQAGVGPGPAAERRRRGSGAHHACGGAAGGCDVHGLQAGFSSQEAEAFSRIKGFCSAIMKKLAPPLLREIESSSKLHAGAEPFTPRRVTRSTAKGLGEDSRVKGKKASAAETVLLRTLGITSENLSVEEEDLRGLREFFDSPHAGATVECGRGHLRQGGAGFV